MGGCLSKEEYFGLSYPESTLPLIPPNYHVYVKTGETKGAGTSSSVFIAFYNADGTKSPVVKHACRCLEEFKAGTMKSFPITFDSVSDFGRVRKIEIGIEKGNEWYVERIEVENVKSKEKDTFPVHRWIKADKKMMLTVHDCTLPQHDEHKDQRKAELEAKKRDYEFMKVDWMIPKIKKLPRDEEFHHVYQSTLDKVKYRAILEAILVGITHRSFRSIDDIKSIYTDVFPCPIGIDDWKEDRKFGALRLAGLNPAMLRLCTDIPEKFPVTDDLLKEFLGGMTINETIEKKRLFIIDYVILNDLPCTNKNAVFPAPLALFFLNDKKDLMPVAIQLFQEPAEDNPISLPSDPEYTWMAAKMWFNLADGSHHQPMSHLASTHLLRVRGDTSVSLTISSDIQTHGASLPALDSNERGVPGNGKFETPEHVIETVTSFIFTSSVTHAAVNFGQYNIYGFPPQYPLTLSGTPPTDKTPLKEADIIKMLPGKVGTLNALVITKLLSTIAANSFGDFEVEYQFDPIGTKAHKVFQEDLKEIGATLESRYETRSVHYPYLHPKDIPNSISV